MADYKEERDAWRLNASPSLRDGGSIRIDASGMPGSSIADEIKKLDDLRKKELISDEEYQAGKKKLLGS